MFLRRGCERVGDQLGIVFFRLDEPNLTILEIVEESLVLLRIGFSCPEQFCAVDFRTVENPIVVYVVALRVAHDDQMFSRGARKYFDDCGAARITRASPTRRIANPMPDD